jgi:hypothetical protein
MTVPRQLDMRVIEIDLTANGIDFAITPHNGKGVGTTNGQTTRQFVTQKKSQIGINGSFSAFGSNGWMVEGIAATQGQVYSPFQQFRRTALNISVDKVATIIWSTDTGTTTGTAHTPNITLYNTLGGEAGLVKNGNNIAPSVNEILAPRSAAGVSLDGRKLLLMTVDGRRPGHSLGVTRPELADLLKEYGAWNAINLDGGGSTTLVFSDPVPRVVNIPSDTTASSSSVERTVGSNLAVFAKALAQPPIVEPPIVEPPSGNPPSGNSVIRAATSSTSEIVITTTNRLAGGIGSLKWQGKEFIDSYDHGRELQSACSFDLARAGEFWSEAFNPTECGSRKNGTGATSTSILQAISALGSELKTTTKMAFWLEPGESSSGRPALNVNKLSGHTLSKRVKIGHTTSTGVVQKNVLEYDVTFTTPTPFLSNLGQFEAVTGYMPADFNTYWKYDKTTGNVFSLSDGPGEQNWPVILATSTGTYAMGVYSPNQPSRGFEGAGYGRFRFATEKVNKFNCVFREYSPTGIRAGAYSYKMFVVVGTLNQVKVALQVLHREFPTP